jgi:hypothetical protein
MKEKTVNYFSASSTTMNANNFQKYVSAWVTEDKPR